MKKITIRWLDADDEVKRRVFVGNSVHWGDYSTGIVAVWEGGNGANTLDASVLLYVPTQNLLTLEMRVLYGE